MPRIKDFDPEQLDPAKRRVYDAILSGPRGNVIGPLRVWLTSPEMADKIQQLGQFIRFGMCIEPRLSELAILVVGTDWKSGFEFWAHSAFALKGGLDPAVVEALRTGKTPAFKNNDEAIVYALSTELVKNRRVSAATYKRAVEALGEQAVVEIVGAVGYYSLVCATINAFEIELPPGEKDPFADVT